MKKTADFYRIHHIEHIIRLFQAGQLQHIQQYIQQLPNSIQTSVRSWWEQYSNTAYTPEAELPASVKHRIEGWHAYFNYDYFTAHQHFSNSIQAVDWQQYAYESALGLSKTYTRSGHWHSAKTWCLYYLYLARQHRDDFALTKGYGALAEIFLRANEAQAALACFQISYQLMPRGQGQNEKQMNYIASALIRNQEFLRAEGLLYSSIQSSLDSQSNTLEKSQQLNIYHSLARLSFKHIAKNGYFHPSQLNKYAQLIQLEHAPQGIQAIPYGFIHVAIAIGYIKEQHKEQALVHLDQAKNAFHNKAYMELAWVTQLICMLQGNADPTVNPQQQHLIHLTPLTPPPIPSVMDLTWQDYPLTNQGFASLFQTQNSIENTIQQWTLFFI